MSFHFSGNVAAVIKLDGVVVSDYSRSRNGYTVFRNISKGEYTGASRKSTTDSAEEREPQDEDFFYLKGRAE